MMEDDAGLQELAGAIAAGARIDWPSAESGAGDDSLREIIRELKVIAEIAGVHCSMPLGGEEPAAVPLPEPISTPLGTWSHFRLVERVGEGAYGEVYRAWDTRLDREVALKLLTVRLADGDARATSIIDEGRLLARVRHPNVVTIYGAERIENRVGLWMEFINGRTLEQILEHRRLTATEGVRICSELCHAVSAVHHAGLLHRDIKAHNVMLAEDGRVVLMDFGTGQELNGSSIKGLAGTPLYVAPELLSGGDATVRSDIYSVGVLLYHLLTGSYPVQGRGLRELRTAHESDERTDVRTARPDLSPRLARIIERTLHRQPEQRYASAEALGAALAALKPHSRVVRLAYALGVAAALMLVVTIGWELRGRQVGSSRTPSALLAGVISVNPIGATNVSPAGEPVIAVLPLTNLSGEPDSDYFVDGLTDEIIRNLAVIQGLQVRSRTSSFAFKDKPRNLRDVGEQLGANLVVEGSVSRSGQRLRINAQLVQVAGDVPLWAERFDRELKDIFAIQDEISRAIVNKLRLTLGRGQRRYDTNPEVYELYLKARALVGRRSTVPALQAAELFEQIIARDPSFAPAYAGAADSYAAASLGIPGPFSPRAISPERALSLMRPAAEAALHLDPLLAEAHAAMGLLYSRDRDWQKAEESFRRAIDLNPSLSNIYTLYASSTLLPMGRQDEAERVLTAAGQADPLSLDVRRGMAEVQIVAGRYEEAIANLKRVEAVDSAFPYVNLHLARALSFEGRLTEALPRWEARKEEPGWQHWMAYAYVKAGRGAEVEQMAAAQAHPYRLAVIYAALGEKDRALEALDRAADIVPHRVAVLTMYPELASIREDPRFRAVRRKLGLP